MASIPCAAYQACAIHGNMRKQYKEKNSNRKDAIFEEGVITVPTSKSTPLANAQNGYGGSPSQSSFMDGFTRLKQRSWSLIESYRGRSDSDASNSD